MKTAIITDSTFYMTKKKLKEENIIQIPLMINFDDKTYKEDQFDANQREAIFERIKQNKELPMTSQPSAGDYLEVFEKLKEEGYERILLFTISTDISGTFHGANTVAQMFMEENHIQVDVFNSCSAASGASIVLFDILKELKKNPLLRKDEIQEIIDWHKGQLYIYLLVDSLTHLSYGGRIPSSLATIGNALGIKPIISINRGKMEEYSKNRSRKKGIKTICDLIKKDTKGQEVPFYFFCNHLYDHQEAEVYYPIVSSYSNTELIKIEPSQLGSVIGTHTGPGTLAFGWTVPFEFRNKMK